MCGRADGSVVAARRCVCVVAVRWWYRVLFVVVLNVGVMGLVGVASSWCVLRCVAAVVVAVCVAVVGVL